MHTYTNLLYKAVSLSSGANLINSKFLVEVHIHFYLSHKINVRKCTLFIEFYHQNPPLMVHPQFFLDFCVQSARYYIDFADTLFFLDKTICIYLNCAELTQISQ